MPIRPENKARYPKDWKEISHRIRFDRAKGVCEFCRIAEHGKLHPITGSKVVLTTAHLDDPIENCSDENLAAMCQKCHLTYDLPRHMFNAATNRIKEKGPVLFPEILEEPIDQSQ